MFAIQVLSRATAIKSKEIPCYTTPVRKQNYMQIATFAFENHYFWSRTHLVSSKASFQDLNRAIWLARWFLNKLQNGKKKARIRFELLPGNTIPSKKE